MQEGNLEFTNSCLARLAESLASEQSGQAVFVLSLGQPQPTHQADRTSHQNSFSLFLLHGHGRE